MTSNPDTTRLHVSSNPGTSDKPAAQPAPRTGNPPRDDPADAALTWATGALGLDARLHPRDRLIAAAILHDQLHLRGY